MSSSTLALLLSASTAWAAVAPAYASTSASAPAYSSAAATSDCAAKCLSAYDACRSAPDANQSLCASNLGACVGYNPFNNNGPFVTPTACSTSSASMTATASAPAYTSGSASQCAQDCINKHSACQSAPNANQAECASEFASCLNYNPYEGTFVTPTACSASSASKAAAATTTAASGTGACAAKCVSEFDACRSAPDANMSLCASNLGACVGYNPFDNSGTFVTPTACSASSTAAATTAATAAATTGASACAAKCVSEFDACRSAPDANMSLCGSNLAGCVNYNPFDNSGTFVTPTACSASSTAAATTAATAAAASSATSGASACAAKCVSEFNACRSAPNANQSLCASNLAGCVNYNPFNNSGTFVTPTACSASSAAATATGYGASNGTSASATYSAPAEYTGAAAVFGSSFMAVAAGAVALMI